MSTKKSSTRRSAEDMHRRAEEAGRNIYVIKRAKPKNDTKKSK